MIGGAPTYSSKKTDVFAEVSDVFDPAAFIFKNTEKNIEDFQTKENKKAIRKFGNKFYKGSGQLLMAAVIHAFSRARVVAPNRNGEFSTMGANSEITIKTKALANGV